MKLAGVFLRFEQFAGFVEYANHSTTRAVVKFRVADSIVRAAIPQTAERQRLTD